MIWRDPLASTSQVLGLQELHHAWWKYHYYFKNLWVSLETCVDLSSGFCFRFHNIFTSLEDSRFIFSMISHICPVSYLAVSVPSARPYCFSPPVLYGVLVWKTEIKMSVQQLSSHRSLILNPRVWGILETVTPGFFMLSTESSVSCLWGIWQVQYLLLYFPWVSTRPIVFTTCRTQNSPR